MEKTTTSRRVAPFPSGFGRAPSAAHFGAWSLGAWRYHVRCWLHGPPRWALVPDRSPSPISTLSGRLVRRRSCSALGCWRLHPSRRARSPRAPSRTVSLRLIPAYNARRPTRPNGRLTGPSSPSANPDAPMRNTSHCVLHITTSRGGLPCHEQSFIGWPWVIAKTRSSSTRQTRTHYFSAGQIKLHSFPAEQAKTHLFRFPRPPALSTKFYSTSTADVREEQPEDCLGGAE